MFVEYRTVPGFPGYRVGDDGTVWTSKVRKGTGWEDGGEWRSRATSIAPNGYVRVALSNNGQITHHGVHRLVLGAFCGPCPEDCEARHLDGNRANNMLSNLAWGTKLENANDKRCHGTMARGGVHGETCAGEKNGVAKLTNRQVLVIDALLNAKKPNKDIAAMFGVARNTISGIKTRAKWRHVLGPATA